jgi:hypothetical protein
VARTTGTGTVRHTSACSSLTGSAARAARMEPAAGRARFGRFGEIAERWVRPWPDGAGKVDRETAREVAADPPLHAT